MDTLKQVQEVIADVIGCKPERVTLDSNLRDDLGADSLDAIEIIMKLEHLYGQVIAEEESAQLKTVEDIVRYIDHINEQN